MEDPVLQSPTDPHFFKPLLPGFHSHINIPMNFFSLHIEGRNERNTVELRSDACDKTWKVRMEGHRLTVGWKEFSRQHNYQTGDIIIFRHEGDLVFHVTGFGPSCCEIQYVKSFNNDDGFNHDHYNIRNHPTKKHVKKRNLAEAKYFSSDQSCFVAPITDSNLGEDRVFLPRKFVRPDGLKKSSSKIVLTNERQRTWTLILKFRESTETFYMRTGWRSFCHENGLQPGDWITFKLHLPTSFTRVNRMETSGGKMITMLDKHGVVWPVNLQMAKENAMIRLGSGLKDFLKANGVKLFESFVLELVWEDKKSPPMLKFCSTIKT